MRTFPPDLMVCAYHQAVQDMATVARAGWERFVAFASAPLPTGIDEVKQRQKRGLTNTGRTGSTDCGYFEAWDT